MPQTPVEDHSPTPSVPATASGTPAGSNRFSRLRKVGDRVPTKWFAVIGTGLFFAVTAGFGGLAQAQTPEVPELEIGTTHSNAQFDITVTSGVLIDELPGSGAFPDESERVLAVVLEARNAWDHPLATVGVSGLSATLRLKGMPDVAPDAIARYDDATGYPWLQPDVPAKLVVTWTVPQDEYADGDEIVLQISDLKLFTGSTVLHGYYWSDPTLAALMPISLNDIGAGVNQE